MKTKLIMTGLLATTLWLPAQVITSSYTNSTSAEITDGSRVGLTEQFSVSGLGAASRMCRGRWTSRAASTENLYAYLAGPQGHC